jgi:hypothetical protein
MVAGCMSRPLLVRVAPPLAIAALLSASCHTTRSSDGQLPATCVQLLLQARCWLRKAGNDAWEVDRAIGAARATLESPVPWGPPHAAADYCQMAQTFRHSTFEGSGCAATPGDLRSLPASKPAACPSEEHFFIRHDGRVIGCRRDCATAKDCPDGSSCGSVGSAPGGPIDEPFCD